MAWRVARSLLTLRAEIDATHPQRSRVSDGTVGDVAHASRASDHNPWLEIAGMGVVTALDITHDPAHGLDGRAYAEWLRRSGDPRIKYIISYRRMASSYPARGFPAWVWRPYSGPNAHTLHTHLSVKPERCDEAGRWGYTPWGVIPAQIPVYQEDDMREGDSGAAVDRLQHWLNDVLTPDQRLTVDGQWGPKTTAALKWLQGTWGYPINGVYDLVMSDRLREERALLGLPRPRQ